MDEALMDEVARIVDAAAAEMVAAELARLREAAMLCRRMADRLDELAEIEARA